MANETVINPNRQAVATQINSAAAPSTPAGTIVNSALYNFCHIQNNCFSLKIQLYQCYFLC